ncbi:response regulator [candidate division CSSED10-310 bacterium]|uniref:Response regulator n=1 Tax=candidate division CSSED10-310 bacterium TaxID=2855610 RepID=A0ABV6YW48_UNCC1
MKIKEPSIYTTGKIAKLCSVSIRTVARWIESDQLKAFRLPGESTEYRVTHKDLLEFLITFGLPYEHIEDEPVFSVLLVDDDPNTTKAVTSALKGIEAQTTLEVVPDLMSGAIQVGLLKPFLFLVDLKLDGPDGFHLLEILKGNETFDETNIIVLSTAKSNSKLGAKLKKIGVDTVMKKPVKTQDIKKNITALIS